METTIRTSHTGAVKPQILQIDPTVLLQWNNSLSSIKISKPCGLLLQNCHDSKLNH